MTAMRIRDHVVTKCFPDTRRLDEAFDPDTIQAVPQGPVRAECLTIARQTFSRPGNTLSREIPGRTTQNITRGLQNQHAWGAKFCPPQPIVRSTR
jgi:hypothetical protein